MLEHLKLLEFRKVKVVEFHTPRVEIYDVEFDLMIHEVAKVETPPHTEGYYPPEEALSTYWRASGTLFFPTTEYFVPVERWSDTREGLFDPEGKWEETDWVKGKAWVERLVQWNANFPLVWWSLY